MKQQIRFSSSKTNTAFRFKYFMLLHSPVAALYVKDNLHKFISLLGQMTVML